MAKKKEAATVKTVSTSAPAAKTPKLEMVPATNDMAPDGTWHKDNTDRLTRLGANLRKAQADEEDLKRRHREIEAEQEDHPDDEDLKIQWFDNRASFIKAKATQKWLLAQILATIDGAPQGRLFKNAPVKPTEAMLFGHKDEETK